jgi:hypothetical protein
VKRFMLVASLVATLSVPLTLLAPSANAASSCTGKTYVGHGIYNNLCINLVANGDGTGAMGLTGTSFSFPSNPLLLKCQVVSTIYDYNTGQPSSSDGTANVAQCTINADDHAASWTPNAALMALKTCTSGHSYYAVEDLVATDSNRNTWTTTGLRTPNFVTCSVS